MRVSNFLPGCYSIFILLAFGQISYSQSATPEQQIGALRNIIPPSPNASSLGKFGSWPVNLYTGLPNISVPVTELKGRSVSVPISLSYHAAGNKVGDVASWVGLGWSLNAGGVITRSVRGLPDEDSYFVIASHYSNPDDLSSTPISTNQQSQDIANSANNLSDTQEDLYSFSAMGKSYKLLLKADGTVQTMPYSNVKVINNPIVGSAVAAANNSWTVILEDGTQLLFGAGTNFTETTSNFRFKASDGTGGMQYTSTWYLNTITSPVGETIHFTYAMGANPIEQDTYMSQSDNVEIRTSTAYSTGGCVLYSDGLLTSNTELQTVTSLNLANIESDLGRVDFILNSTERMDLKGSYSLSEIKVFSKTINQYIEDYIFNTSFTNAISSNELLTGTTNTSYFYYRLRLNSMIRKDMVNASATPQKWSFDYNPQNLPSRRSYSQDHFGFYNGANTNYSLLPPVYYQVPDFALVTPTNVTEGFLPSSHDISSNRSVNPNFIQAEMLAAIHYPTGGSSKFVFEPNSYPDTAEQFTAQSNTLTLNLTGTSHATPSQSLMFTITKPQYVSLNFTCVMSSNIDVSNPGVNVSITNASNQQVVSTNLINQTNGLATPWFDIRTAGTYTLTYSINFDPSTFDGTTYFLNGGCTLTYQKSLGVLPFSHFVGGLRTYSIADNDGINPTDVNLRYFKYALPLVINPLDTVNDYLTTITRSTYSTSEPTSGQECDFTKVLRNTSTKYSLGSVEGGAVGYGQVTTLYGLNGINGFSVSTFNNEPDVQVNLAKVFPYPATDSRDWRRGLLLEQRDYDASNHIVKRMDQRYSFTTIGSEVGWKAGFSYYEAPYLCQDAYRNCGTTRGFCYTTIEQVKHDSTLEVNYSNTTGDSLQVATNYYYDNALNTQPVRTATTDSKGLTVLTYSRTALEKADINASTPLTSTASLAIDTMVARNMVGIPVETERYTNGIINKKALTNFKIQSTGFVLPDNIMLQNGTGPLETRVQFSQYDSKGNLQEQSKTNDLKEVYLYGYSSNYPVAKITNTTYSIASSYINQAILDNPADDGTLRNQLNNLRTIPGSLVTTYTYAPLVGQTSITDPAGKTNYYEYDGFNRLKNIKDYQGNIVKNYQYNYANSCGNNCVVLPMQTFTSYNTPSYPVGVFNGGKQYIGIANNPAQYVTLWNSNAANQAIGVLSANTDSLHFNLSLAANAIAPPALYGLRFYQWDNFTSYVYDIATDSLSYVDWGDGTQLLITTRSKMYDTIPYGYVGQYLHDDFMYHWVLLSHTYINSQKNTITVFHNETTEMVAISGSYTNDITQNANIRGYYPEKLKGLAIQYMSYSTDAGIANISKLTELLNIHYSIINPDTSQHHLWQNLNGCHKVKWIKMYDHNGSDIISDLPNNFPNLLYFEAQTYKPDITQTFGNGGFPNMYIFIVGLFDGTSLSSSEINLVVNTQAAANTITNGFMGFAPIPVVTSPGAGAYNTLIARGWTMQITYP